MKIDMHVHTKYSYDGVSEVGEVFDWAERRGLDGVAITDHFDIRAREEAREEAQKRNMFFIPGEEIRILNERKKTVGEVLIYFINSGVGNKQIEGIKEFCDEENAVMFMAHPYAKSRPSPERVEDFLDYLDGLETFNARSRMNRLNTRAANLAEGEGLPVIGGSDAHMPREVGYGYTEVEDASDLEEFKEGLIGGRSVARGHLTNAVLHYVSQIRGRV